MSEQEQRKSNVIEANPVEQPLLRLSSPSPPVSMCTNPNCIKHGGAFIRSIGSVDTLTGQRVAFPSDINPVSRMRTSADTAFLVGPDSTGSSTSFRALEEFRVESARREINMLQGIISSQNKEILTLKNDKDHFRQLYQEESRLRIREETISKSNLKKVKEQERLVTELRLEIEQLKESQQSYKKVKHKLQEQTRIMIKWKAKLKEMQEKHAEAERLVHTVQQQHLAIGNDLQRQVGLALQNPALDLSASIDSSAESMANISMD